MAVPRRANNDMAATRIRATTITIFLLCLLVVAAIVHFFRDNSSNAVVKHPASRYQHQQLPLLFNESESNPWKRELMARLDRIRLACGELCTLNDQEQIQAHSVNSSSEPGRSSSFPAMHVPNVNCEAIIGNEDIDATDWTFPSSIPPELMPFFTVNGSIHWDPVKIFQQQYQGGDALTSKWTEADLEVHKTNAMTDLPTLRGGYGASATRMVREKLRPLNLLKKSVLVIGSETPWVEVICLGLGAAQVTTLEYGRIESTHPQVRALTPPEFRKHYQDGTLGQFDLVVSHSSLEHSGLGRYGDALNPWGDILALARAWCVTKPGGGLYLGLPTGKDRVVYNAHRVYGKVRWPLITVNWQQVDADNHTNEEFDKETVFGITHGGTAFLFRKPLETGNR